MKEMLGIRTLGFAYFPLALLVHVLRLLMLAGTVMSLHAHEPPVRHLRMLLIWLSRPWAPRRRRCMPVSAKPHCAGLVRSRMQQRNRMLMGKRNCRL